jgi:hypothetical protein
MFIKVFLSSLLLILCSLIWERLAWLMVLAWIFMLGSIAMLLYAFYTIFRHRPSINHWASSSAALGEATMDISGTGYHLKTRTGDFIVKWTAIERVELYDDHVIISGSDQRLFAKSSMTDEDFTYLCDILRTKVLEPAKIIEVETGS